ncbi:MAG: citrate synthase [Deferribacteres bacterium]|nr:citrate synthase [candidate division KSB1 bacterium]MCB9501699.1 citrate synthase [Deferribacteres bacterium]
MDKFGNKHTYNEGMEGVLATTSEICHINGKEGKLIYRGIPIEELAEKSTFEETSYFLLYGELPTRKELDDFDARLKANRALPQEVLSIMKQMPSQSNTMQFLRTVVSLLGLYETKSDEHTVIETSHEAEKLIAVFPTIVAAIQRLREGKEPIAPDNSLGHAANLIYMVNGEKPDEFAARVLDICLILHAEHGFNASTFTSRVVISTLTDVHSAITAAIGSLRGPLHGGANEGVMHLLNEIGSLDKVEEIIKIKLETKAKIMGFGHRVYKVLDPRARILSQYSERLAQITGNETYYAMSKKIEDIMKREVGDRGIYPNVDFFSASVYHYLGFKLESYTPIFAVSRISGWAAHVMEQLRENRLFRPSSVYLGDIDRKYISISER